MTGCCASVLLVVQEQEPPHPPLGPGRLQQVLQEALHGRHLGQPALRPTRLTVARRWPPSWSSLTPHAHHPASNVKHPQRRQDAGDQLHRERVPGDHGARGDKEDDGGRSEGRDDDEDEGGGGGRGGLTAMTRRILLIKKTCLTPGHQLPPKPFQVGPPLREGLFGHTQGLPDSSRPAAAPGHLGVIRDFSMNLC